MSDPEQTEAIGSMGAAREALNSFWSLLEKRLELAATEFQEQRHRLMRQLVWLAAVALLGLMALFSLTCLIMALAWDTPARNWVIGALALVYAGGAMGCFFVVRRQVAESPPPFSATIDEFRKDREWFRKGS